LGASLAVLVCVTLAIGMPVAFGLGIVSIGYFLLSDFPLTTIPQKMFGGMDSFLLLAIPFFLLAGSLMNHGGVTQRLVDFASTLVGHIHGGLGHVTVVANVIMAGMSGTAAADAAATGQVLIPQMIRKGYSRGFAAAISASAATIGPIIPPSVSFIIFGSITNVSIGALFLAGFIPGLLMGVYLMAACWLVSRRRGYGADRARAGLRELGVAVVGALPALLTPVWVLGGMIGGVVTPTEAAAVAVVYSLILGVAHGELRWRHAPPILNEVAVLTAAIYLLLAVFNVLGWILAVEQIPQTVVGGFLALTDSPAMALLIINVMLLLLGILIEPLPLLVILGPMLVPVIETYGIDPVHFGVVFVLNVLIGVVTPPIGTNMFITCAIAKCPVGEFARESWPFIAALVALLMLITYVPWLTLFLPRLLMG
jgi:C4-dicarboxylate transporter DctM subunit